MPTLRHMLNRATARLAAAGVDSPRLSAQVLAGHALGCDRLQLVLRAEDPLTPAQAEAVEALLARRETGEPVAYITGQREFYGRNFTVTPATLIPRPETEELVEAALRHVSRQSARFADLGTGSGCIAVSLAAERPHWLGCMLDISDAALGVALGNAARHGVERRLLAVRGDLCVPPLSTEVFDLIISNPPYISAAEYAALSREVRRFEPAAALTPDVTGLAHAQAIAAQAGRLLCSGGWCMVEHGSTQGRAVRDIFAGVGGWVDIVIHKDMAGLDRFCTCRKAAEPRR